MNTMHRADSTGNLFGNLEQSHFRKAQPLAASMRPRNFDEFHGQQHFCGEGKLLRRMLQAERLSSLIFYGPPGTGKTTLAHLIARHTRSHFTALNAAAIHIKEVRESLVEAHERLATDGQHTILFLDELHRFSRAQQDVLLPDVENGIVTLIGATTQNPFFSIVSPLVSRSQIFQFKPLTPSEIRELLEQAIQDPVRGLGNYQVQISKEALDFLSDVCDGDARQALNALEIGVLSSKEESVLFDLETAQESLQKKAIQYDATGDTHYDVTSAFIKSMRGSDPDAAIYWLARMLEAGEEPRFIARRLVICASEDIGNADPMALVVATAAAQATEFIGLPECQLSLAQAVTYLATAPKSNASTMAILDARHDVLESRVQEVPKHLKDSHYPGAPVLGNGQGYQYPHDSENGWVDQNYLGIDRQYYHPVDRGHESIIRDRLEDLRSEQSPRSDSK